MLEDINQREKENLYQWACRNHSEETEKKYFSPIVQNCTSYYEDVSSSEKCREYAFQTADELQSELAGIWQDDEEMKQIIKIVLVASMKNKPIGKEGLLHTEKESGIKSYIYNF